MPIIKSRVAYSSTHPYRIKRPSTSKIVFLSFEGHVTEEEYFEIVSDIFSSIKSKIQFISVAEDAVRTHHKLRTREQESILSKSRPKQLVERIEQFKQEKSDIYQFEQYPEDEFWVVTDVDSNWSPLWINEWNEAITKCDANGYKYAISNPFFEVWLLLHHDNCKDEDQFYAVTNEHEYEKTSHFRERLRELKVPLKKEKQVIAEHYSEEKILQAIERAKALHLDPSDMQPKYFSSTVYILIQKIIEML